MERLEKSKLSPKLNEEVVSWRCVLKKDVLRNFPKLTEKCLKFSTLLKKTPLHRCFPVNFVKCLRAPLFIELPRCLSPQSLHLFNEYGKKKSLHKLYLLKIIFLQNQQPALHHYIYAKFCSFDLYSEVDYEEK